MAVPFPLSSGATCPRTAAEPLTLAVKAPESPLGPAVTSPRKLRSTMLSETVNRSSDRAIGLPPDPYELPPPPEPRRRRSIRPPRTAIAGARPAPRDDTVTGASIQPPRRKRSNVRLSNAAASPSCTAPSAERPATSNEISGISGTAPSWPDTTRDPVSLRGFVQPRGAMASSTRLRSLRTSNVGGWPLAGISTRTSARPVPETLPSGRVTPMARNAGSLSSAVTSTIEGVPAPCGPILRRNVPSTGTPENCAGPLSVKSALSA